MESVTKRRWMDDAALTVVCRHGVTICEVDVEGAKGIN